MGRPVNKRYFGSGSGNQIKVRAKVGTNAEGDGYIVSQRSTNKFIVTVGANTGTCKVVNKSSGTLADNEMIINVLTDDGTFKQATKLYNRVAIVEGNQKVKWTFDASAVDEAVQIPDVEGTIEQTITIDTQPANATVAETETATFTVVASGVGDLTYQWQISEDTGSTWNDIVGATSASYETDPLTVLDNDGEQYRVIVGSLSGAADPVTSTAATLTVTA